MRHMEFVDIAYYLDSDYLREQLAIRRHLTDRRSD